MDAPRPIQTRGFAMHYIPSIWHLLILMIVLTVGTAAAFGQAERPAEKQSTKPAAPPSDAERTRAEIIAMLNTFLSPEQNGRREAHELFWADDLIYTGSTGMVRTKATILKSFDDAPKPDPTKPAEPSMVFSAEDIVVRSYGETAALTFRLVGRAADGTVSYYRNSGTFVRRGGKWQAVTWQATKVAEPAK